jgi:hypothetical protein
MHSVLRNAVQRFAGRNADKVSAVNPWGVSRWLSETEPASAVLKPVNHVGGPCEIIRLGLRGNDFLDFHASLQLVADVSRLFLLRWVNFRGLSRKWNREKPLVNFPQYEKTTKGFLGLRWCKTSPRLSRMNKFQADELAAAAQLRAKAATLVSTYAEPQDAAAARLAVLMIAAQQEAREQGIHAELVFSHQEQE